MKPSYLFLLLFACSNSNIATDQLAFHYENKGITCDAMLHNKSETMICGESSVYNSSAQAGSVEKDALLLISSDGGRSSRGISYGNPGTTERFEKITTAENAFYLGGFTGDEKMKFLLKLNAQYESAWGIQSERFKTLEPGDMVTDAKGNTLLITKDPAAESYHGFLHLINKDGACLWSKDVPSVDVMQDIITTGDGNYLVSFKQKGAYIDGSTRKKYWMNAFHKINTTGELIWSRKFHIEYDLVDDCIFSEILEDKSGNLYFIGKADLRSTTTQHLLIIKTDKEGRIAWSTLFNCIHQLNFKNGCFDANGNMMFVADGYGKNGGMAFIQMKPDGTIIWSKFIKTANYEQGLQVFSLPKAYEIVWDKLLNFALFTLDAKGNSCFTNMEDLKCTPQKFPVLLDAFTSNWKNVDSDWKKTEVRLVTHQNLKAVSDCK